MLRSDGTAWLNLGSTYYGSGGAGGDYNKNGIREGQPRWKQQRFTHHENSDKNRQPRNHPVHQVWKPKDLVPIPWLVALELQRQGWWLRSEIIWAKKSAMPESVTDRPTRSHEQVFLLAKSQNYFYDSLAIAETSEPEQTAHNLRYARPYDNADRIAGGQPGNVNNVGIHSRPGTGTRNRRDVWLLGPKPYAEAHFATFPSALVTPCILAGTSAHGCCAECGAPWARVTVGRPTERIDYNGKNATQDPQASHRRILAGVRGARAAGGDHDNPFPPKETTGWSPTCSHDATVEPCTVLDPFSGSGTSGVVAVKLGRRYIGIELNAEYVTMSERRIATEAAIGNTEETAATVGAAQLSMLAT